MKKDTVIALGNPEDFRHDLLTEVLRHGAQQLLATAVEAEVQEFLMEHAHDIRRKETRRALCVTGTCLSARFKRVWVR